MTHSLDMIFGGKMMKKLIRTVVALACAAAPACATAAPYLASSALSVAQGTQSISFEQAVRPVQGVPGGSYIASGMLAGVVGVAILLFTQDDDVDSD